MLDVLAIIGVVIVVIGGIMLLIEAFKESIIWGVACLLINPVSIIFLILHWGVSKKPFFIQLTGFGVILVSALIK